VAGGVCLARKDWLVSCKRSRKGGAERAEKKGEEQKGRAERANHLHVLCALSFAQHTPHHGAPTAPVACVSDHCAALKPSSATSCAFPRLHSAPRAPSPFGSRRLHSADTKCGAQS